MPEQQTIERARRDKAEGKAPTTQAGEFVREEMRHIRGGKHGARSAKQAIAIGLSKARRAGVKLPPPRKGTVSEKTRRSAQRAYQKGQAHPWKRPSPKRSRARLQALKREGRGAASFKSLSRQARSAARSRRLRRRPAHASPGEAKSNELARNVTPDGPSLSMPAKKQSIVQTILKRYGVTFAEELQIHLHRQTPSELFKLLCAALLFSARIGHQLACRTAAELFRKGWTHPKKMAAVTWEERARTLNAAGYARYDERTSTMLEQTSRLLLDRYGGDLKQLREQANRDPATERKLLKEFKGIGDVGVDIFFREAQLIWDELYPFADKRALQSAKKLGLAKDARTLAKLVPPKQFPRLVAALVRIALEKKPTSSLRPVFAGSR